MTEDFATDQEAFWAGDFGDEYIQRNRGAAAVAANTALFARVLGTARDVGSVLEYGANIGLNLRAIGSLLPAAELTGVDINARAVTELATWGGCTALRGSLLDEEPAGTADLVLVKGVLIHVAPERLADAYETIHRSARRYICLAEYYAPRPTSVTYRGHDDRLFKRDFAGEFLDGYPGTRLVDYGFAYHRDPVFAHDDISWFLLEKTS